MRECGTSLPSIFNFEKLLCTIENVNAGGYSIKRTCSIKLPGLEYFKKSLLNVPSLMSVRLWNFKDGGS